MKDSIKVEMWASKLGMFVRGVMRHGSMEICKRDIIGVWKRREKRNRERE